MTTDAFNMSMRKFLKQVGVTSQREIARVAHEVKAKGRSSVKLVMRLTAEGEDLDHVIEQVIKLD